MKPDFYFVCDYAEVTGKINALGIGFDTIYAPSVPRKHPHFFLVIQLRANVVEAGEKTLEVRLIDEDGKDIIPTVRGKFTIPKPAVGTESIGRIALELQNVEFPRYCSYSLHAVIEGQEMVRVPLKVSPPPQAK
jgi:hypothetical protein